MDEPSFCIALIFMLGCWNTSLHGKQHIYYTSREGADECKQDGIIPYWGLMKKLMCTDAHAGKKCENDKFCDVNEECLCDNLCEEQRCKKKVVSTQCNKCLNGATCFNQTCICDQGWEGDSCEIATNLCKICSNGGTCSFANKTSKCYCVQGWTGDDCTINEDDCYPNPCVHGICEDQVGRYSCHCFTNFTGDNCEFKTCNISCELKNANCTNNQCACKSGFHGENCEDIDECLNFPCGSHGTCNNTVGSFVCNCHSSYIGVLCDKKIYCTNTSCGNHGTCQEEKLGFSCKCDNGYTGARCEIQIDLCNSNLCNNKGCFNDIKKICQCDYGWKGQFCEVPRTDNCFSNPCIHGSCFDTNDDFFCKCKPGFTNRLCSEPIDMCPLGYCLNNGTCAHKFNQLSCDCLPQFSGDRCQFLKDFCASNPCTLNSKCINEFNSYKCVCNAGFYGKNCQQSINWCTPSNNPCENKGKCQLTSDGFYSCTCSSNWTGSTCAYSKSDSCTIGRCNDGNCKDNQFGGYHCTCPANYSGSHCQNPVPFCSQVTCKNNGVCVDGKCLCIPGFEGTLCEIDINECAKSPCNNGNCTDAVNGFICSCNIGYTGLYCETHIPNCFKGACFNNGDCHDSNTGFSCNCTPGFQGSRCQKRICPSCGKKACASDTCVNGKCLDLKNDHECICDENFIGENCSFGIGFNSTQCPYEECQATFNGGLCNPKCDNPQCNWDGTDCTLGVNPWTQCESKKKQCWRYFGDGICDVDCNNMNCLFDGYDCQIKSDKCPVVCAAKFGNGYCDNDCNSVNCGYDNKECSKNIPAKHTPGFLVITLRTGLNEFELNKYQFIRNLSIMLNTILTIEQVEAPNRIKRSSTDNLLTKVTLKMDNSLCTELCFDSPKIAASYLGARAQKQTLNLKFSVYSVSDTSKPKLPTVTHNILIVLSVSVALVVVVVGAKKMRFRLWKFSQDRPIFSTRGEAEGGEELALSPSLSACEMDSFSAAKKLKSSDQAETEVFIDTRRHINQNELLHQAIILSKIDDVLALLDRGVDANGVDNFGVSPLQKCVLRNNSEAFRLLLRRSNIDHQCHLGKTALMMACYYKDCCMLEELLAVGARVTLTDMNGYTALHHAALAANSSAIHILHKNNAKVDVQDSLGQTPLYLASASLSIDAVGALLAHYANRNLADNMDKTPLMIAKEAKHPQLIRMLSDWDGSPQSPISPNNIPKLVSNGSKKRKRKDSWGRGLNNEICPLTSISYSNPPDFHYVDPSMSNHFTNQIYPRTEVTDDTINPFPTPPSNTIYSPSYNDVCSPNFGRNIYELPSPPESWSTSFSSP